MRKAFFLLIIAPIFLLMLSCKTNTKNVTIIKKMNHYEITLDFTNGISHRALGEQYGKELIETIPEYEEINNQIIETFVKDICFFTKKPDAAHEVFNALLEKARSIRPEIYKDYYDELEGICSNFHYDATNDYTDKLLSRDEFYLINLLFDIGGAIFGELIKNDRTSLNCCSISVFNDGSATGNPIIARILDCPTKKLNLLHAVTTVKNKEKSICIIGFAGCTGIYSAFNKSDIFAAVYYSHTGKKCIPDGKERSLTYDLRYALENFSSLDEVAGYIKNNKSNYISNCLISLSDRNEAKVLECDLTANKKSCELRSHDSKLIDGISWRYKNIIANVNSFLLSGNEDNHSAQPMNYSRWNSINELIEKMTNHNSDSGSKITRDELKKIASYYKGDRPHDMNKGDIYNDSTGQIIIYQPVESTLSVFFCSDKKSQQIPDFQIIDKPDF